MFKDKCEKLLISRETQNAALFEKIVMHENISVQLLYGECDIVSNLSKHALSFVYDAFLKNEENSILRFNCNKALLSMNDCKRDNKNTTAADSQRNSNLNRIASKDFIININKEEKKLFETLEEDIYGEYDAENRSNRTKDCKYPKSQSDKGGNSSYSSNFLLKENNNFNNNDAADSLNRSSINNHNYNNNSKKTSYVRNKAELSDKSIICLNCSKKIFLNNMPNEVSSMVNLTNYYQDCLESKYPNFALEKVMNYFCFYFSVQLYFDIENKKLGNNASSVVKNKSTFNSNKSFNYSTTATVNDLGAGAATEASFDVFDNLLFFCETKNFFVYKRNDYSIVFVYHQGVSNKNYVVLNLEEYISLASEKKNRSQL